jgi:hypothetical protein
MGKGMAGTAEYQPLRLRIRDAEDLGVVAAVLQDALVPVQDMRFLPAEKRFVMIANRFCWERAPEALDAGEEAEEPQGDASFREAQGSSVYQRVNCGLGFERVRGARLRGFDLADRGRILELLTLDLSGERLHLTFAGNAAIELTLERVSGFLEDLGEPWPTLRRPVHPDLES